MSELLNFLTLDNLKQTTGLMKESPLSISRWITMPFRWPWGSGRYKAIWKVRLMLDILLVKSHETRQGMCLPKHCWIQGRGPWGAAAPSLFQTKLRSEGSEKIFWRPGSPLISGSEWPGPLLISRSASGNVKGSLSSMRMSRSSISKSSLHGF